MILLIDNYDSFVFNLARYVRELGEETVVRRHDATSYEEIQALRPSHIIISPGPCSPGEAGISTEVGAEVRAQGPEPRAGGRPAPHRPPWGRRRGGGGVSGEVVGVVGGSPPLRGGSPAPPCAGASPPQPAAPP